MHKSLSMLFIRGSCLAIGVFPPLNCVVQSTEYLPVNTRGALGGSIVLTQT